MWYKMVGVNYFSILQEGNNDIFFSSFSPSSPLNIKKVGTCGGNEQGPFVRQGDLP